VQTSSVTGVGGRFRCLFASLLTAIVTGALIAAILTTAVLATEYLPADRAQANLRRSFENGSLRTEDWPWNDRIRGYNQYNDCLIVMMIRFRRDPVSSAIAPVVVFNDYPIQTKLTECQIARTATFSNNPRELFSPKIYFPYYRYIHAYRIPFNILIEITSVDVIRIIYRCVIILLLLTTILCHVWRTIHSIRLEQVRAAAASACFVIVASGMGIFSGLDLFAQSLTHGPSDILIFSAFAWLSLRKDSLGVRYDIQVATLGALAFAFDFLHGTIPLTLAIVLGCAGLRAFGRAAPAPLASAGRAATVFVVGVVAAAATKLLTLIAVSGWHDITGFYYQLRYRMDGGEHSLAQAASALWSSSSHIAGGLSMVGGAAIAFSLLCTLIVPVAAFMPSISSKDRRAILTAWLSMCTIFCWYVVFRAHSAVHAPFMVRLLAWPISMGPACLMMLAASAGWLEGGLRTVPFFGKRHPV